MIFAKGGSILYIKKWLIIANVILLIFLAVNITYAADNHPWELFFAGQRTSSEIQVVEKKGNLFINLPFLSKYFNIITACLI